MLLDYGAAGYGLYWYCVELIAQNVTENNITFELEHDSRIIARNLNLTVKETQDMMKKMIELNLFSISKNEKLACYALAKRIDQSMTSSKHFRGLIKSFKESHDEVMQDKTRLDKTRLDKTKQKKRNLEDYENFNRMTNEAKSLFTEYIELRDSLKLKTTAPIITRLLNKFLKFGSDTQVIENAINANWKDFYEIKTNTNYKSSKQKEPEVGSIAWRMKQEQNVVDTEVVNV